MVLKDVVRKTSEIILLHESIGHDPVHEDFFNKEWVEKEYYDEVISRLKGICFWRNGKLTCEQEIEKLLHILKEIETKDKEILKKLEGEK